MRQWHATDWSGEWPVQTTDGAIALGQWRTSIDGPDKNGDIEITVDDPEQTVSAYIPVAVLANHLRLAGWVCTPPNTEPAK